MNSVAELPIDHLNELQGVAQFIIDFASGDRHFLFYGPMGAGKTTLIKQLCATLGSSDNHNSPSYAIANEYQSPGGALYHIDLYRVQSQTELLDLGMEEYLHSGSYCFIEWPERVAQMMEKAYVKVELEPRGESRFLRVTKYR